MTDNVELEQMSRFGAELDCLHRIAAHVATGDPLDETLASALDFAVWLVRCDECSAYIRKGAELVPWVWKYSVDKTMEEPRLAVDREYVAALGGHGLPIAISRSGSGSFRIKQFEEWSTDPGEALVSIPLAARSQLLGTVNLRHQQPRAYSSREFKLLSSVGHLLGVDILLTHLEKKNSDLVLQLEARKLVERGKGILQRDLGLSEQEAYLALQRQSRQKRRPMKEIARAIILHDEARRNSLVN